MLRRWHGHLKGRGRRGRQTPPRSACHPLQAAWMGCEAGTFCSPTTVTVRPAARIREARRRWAPASVAGQACWCPAHNPDPELPFLHIKCGTTYETGLQVGKQRCWGQVRPSTLVIWCTLELVFCFSEVFTSVATQLARRRGRRNSWGLYKISFRRGSGSQPSPRQRVCFAQIYKFPNTLTRRLSHSLLHPSSR